MRLFRGGRARSTLIALASVFVAAYAFFYYVLPGMKTSSPADEDGVGPYAPVAVIDVAANGGSFTPKDFDLKQSEGTVLRITAEDRDYVFRIPGQGFDINLPKGVSVDVNLSTLGIGSYSYECGEGCGGSLNVPEVEISETEDESGEGLEE